MFTLHGKKVWMLGLVVLLVVGGLTPAFAQSIWLDRSVDRGIWLEIQKPNFSKESDPADAFTFATSFMYLSTRWRAAGAVVLRGEIP
ncbi:MAG: hypothetical protein L0209_07280, partial [candidate division Zixibacteria bacterium]|nr:hypothetical protein [candidate division Zixibacteria bacterium]